MMDQDKSPRVRERETNGAITEFQATATPKESLSGMNTEWARVRSEYCRYCSTGDASAVAAAVLLVLWPRYY